MGFLRNKMVVAIICIVLGILVLPPIGMPAILLWIIGIVLIVYGILVLLGKK
jgi:hypothetical protein